MFYIPDSSTAFQTIHGAVSSFVAFGPMMVSEGYLLASKVTAQGGKDSGDVQFPKSGTFAASEEFYHFGNYTIYEGLASDIAAISGAESGVKEYLRCSDTARCSSTTQMRGGSD